MEVVGTVMSVVQTLLEASKCLDLKDFLSIFGYQSQLDDLQGTVSFIQAVFQDAERKRTLSAVELKLIEDLKDAIYEADDLLDEFVTLAKQKQLLNADGHISKKLCRFFSRTNPFGVAYRMSKGVKKIKKKLDAIAYNKQFCFDYDPGPIRKRRPETCSYVDTGEIIGREENLDMIVSMLLDPNVERDVSFLSIVGIGGLGKTALAQLVYNDPRITTAFPLRKWACVSDEGQNDLNVEEILRRIVGENQEGCTVDQVRSQLQGELANKRYLLVLDDVWTENCFQWRELEKYLTTGHRGSWIVVTTRSQQTAAIIRDVQLYELKGLSKENSWRLFQKTAFGSDKLNPPQDLVMIGQGIVNQCARNPLAIRVVGSLLYGQDKQRWQSVHEIGLANIRTSENDIIPILKLSYYHLASPLKSCFSYCSLFPKDCKIERERLISLWMAQGYVVPLDEGQSIEDAGEEYFLILLRRCFFQDIKKNSVGDIESVKIHDLMHDIAQSVSRKEICATSSGKLDKSVRHFSIGNTQESGKYTLGKTHIRSYVCYGKSLYSRISQVKVDDFFIQTLVLNYWYLRTLDLGGFMKSLPDSIGTLLHLRYLDFSNNDLELLPKSITRLCNLQTLNLKNCKNLKELPKDFSKLVELRSLDISYCSNLHYMPRYMDKLTCLHRLTDFIVGSQSSSSWKQWFYGLEEMKTLKNLKGRLDITIRSPKTVGEADVRKRGLYLDKEHLNHINIDFRHGKMYDEGTITLMEDLRPHANLKKLEIVGYHGTRMPDWPTLLPNLVNLKLWSCKEVEYLTNFGSAKQVSFLPSLEQLWLQNMPKLKGWRRGIVGVEDDLLPQLKSLAILCCPELTSIPLCPKLEILKLRRFNKRLEFEKSSPAAASASFEVVANPFPKLRDVKLDNVAWLKSFPMSAFHCIERLDIKDDKYVKNLGDVSKVFHSCSSSLRSLSIHNCPRLRSVVAGGLEHLTALEELRVWDCENTSLLEEEAEDTGVGYNAMSSLSFLPSLRTLKLGYLPQLENLPNWMQFLSALQTLEISNWRKLKAMPNWMTKLISLKHLEAPCCSASLERRCQKEPVGEDWPYIQHILVRRFICCRVLRQRSI